MPSSRNPIGLEYLSTFGMPLLDYAELAAGLGCDFISVNYRGAANRLTPPTEASLRDDAAMRKELTNKVRELGLQIKLVEGFAITDQITADSYLHDLDDVAEMGAASICAVSMDKDFARSCAQFAALAEAGAERGLRVTTELGAGTIRNITKAQDALGEIRHANFALLIDTMHFFRSGANVADLAALPIDAIAHVQLCDVPMPAQMDSYMEEALYERRALGDGHLPLQEFVRALPRGIPLGLEMPVRSQMVEGALSISPIAQSIAKLCGWLDDAAIPPAPSASP